MHKNKTTNKILIIGGAKSGKTRFALKLGEAMLSSGQRGLYVATCQPLDHEMKAKVSAHRRERSGLWDTLEEKIAVERASGPTDHGFPHGVILVDCLTMWMLNVIEEHQGHEEQRIHHLVKWFKTMDTNVIMVTNEVGLGIVPEGALTRRYRDLLGLLNQEMAGAATEVFFVMAGMNLKLKGRDQ